jgi:hypothetical protein
MSNAIQVIGFGDTANLPAYLRDPALLAEMAKVNDDIQNFASYPSLSIKGKVWAIIANGERKTIMKPNAPDETAQFIEGVMIRGNDKARTYYAKKFTERDADEGTAPDCSSNDGIAPLPNSPNKQSEKCATCPHAVWGSRVNEDGTGGKGTACSQNARIAFAMPDLLDKPFLLRVPPKSLKPMRDAIDLCRQRKLPYSVVVMKLGFNSEEASPVITFRPVGLLPADAANMSIKMRDEQVVKQICGVDGVVSPPPAPVAAPPADDPASDLDRAIAAQAQAATAPPPAPVPAPPPPPPVAPPPPAPAPVVAAPAVAVVNAGDDLFAELSKVLGSVDKPINS